MSDKKITTLSKDEKKMIRQMFWRSLTLFTSVTPSKMGGTGFVYSMMPAIDRYYRHDQEGKIEALKRHLVYFNCAIPLSTFIMGLVASMEKKNAENSDFDSDSVNAIKLSLMGPLSGISDPLFWGGWRVICAGIGIGLAKTGNVFTPILFLIMFNIPTWIVRYFAGFYGYSLGTTYLQKLIDSGLINIVTKAAEIIGVLMVGAMTSQLVKFKTVLAISMNGQKIMNFQSILNSIFKGLVPISFTLLVFWLMQKKNWGANFMIISIIILGVLLKWLRIC